jgi:iron complex transport system ATP-binding protein
MLDEPTSRLDIGSQIEIFDLIKNLNIEKNITIIAVLHDLNLAGDYCDRVMIMNKGSVFKIGDIDATLTYQNIEEVYNTTVLVKESPATRRPHIVLVPKYRGVSPDQNR